MKPSKLILIALITIPLICFSQGGTLDTSFGEDGVVRTDFYGERDICYTVVQQSNGKIVVLGKIKNQSISNNILARYMPNGDLDSSFGENGVFQTENHNDRWAKMIVQSDDKIIIARILNDNLTDYYLLTRRLPDGELDYSFGDYGNVKTILGKASSPSSLLLQEDGKIVVIGFYFEGEDKKIILVRYLPNGDLDSSFGVNGIVTTFNNNDYSYFISGEIQDNGNIVVIVRIDYSGDELMLIQYLPEGNIDSSFGDNGTIVIDLNTNFIYKNAFVLNKDNKILFASSLSENNDQKTIVMRFLSNGNLDTSFGINGKAEISFAHLRPTKLLVTNENKLLIYSQTWGNQGEGNIFEIIRLNEDGTIDSTFGENGIISKQFESYDAILQNDEKILGVGSTYWFVGVEDFYLVRYNYNNLSVTDFSTVKLNVSPNPSKGIFKINYNFIDSEIPYLVSDITGKVIQKGAFSGEYTVIDLSTVQKGIYFLYTSGSTLKLVRR